MSSSDPVVILGYARTPLGSFQGALKGVAAPALGAVAIRAAVERSGVASTDIDEAIMGCVLTAGLGQAPARQAAIQAGLPDSVPCATVGKVCGSGMKAVMIAADQIRAGGADVIVAGGMESMSRAPYLLDRARVGFRLGHGRVIDHMFLDGLEDAYDPGRLMGSFAEDCAEAYQFTREMQDAFAIESLTRAKRAIADEAFADEIVPVVADRYTVSEDEAPGKARPDKIRTLKPAFKSDGTITAANASSISDGAAALVLTHRTLAEKKGLAPRAVLVGQVSYAQRPAQFTTAPIGAIAKLMQATDWSLADVDLFEINEAFAVVAMAAMRDLDLSHAKVNVHGGACALGHPIGASGARILVTLLSALERHKLRRGVAALCIGGGEATAMAVERF
jgi:acetyl-CoA C-acetyltransferase